MQTCFCAPSDGAIPIHVVTSETAEGVLGHLTASQRAFAEAVGFKPNGGKAVSLPCEGGEIEAVLFGYPNLKDGLALAALPNQLPDGCYRFATLPDEISPELAAIAWADGAYRFTRYKSVDSDGAQLVLEDGNRADTFAEAMGLLRDMVNTPAEDMGPSAIEAAIRTLTKAHGAAVDVVVGDDLLKQNYPMVHAVGRAADDAPRLIELTWGNEADPTLAIVGKGVAFDTGGLNIKTGNYMLLMKKDMGGAAHAIATALLVMALGLPVHLKLFVPAVENAIGPTAFRPSDILQSRKGLTVEIENTDAEGRLILGDALTRACEFDPDLVVDFATLTGAARIALGPDPAPYYTDDETVADGLEAGSRDTMDPVWRMPLWWGYEDQMKSPIADLSNTGDSPMGGSITAALFLKNFVDREAWVHYDVWSWRPARYGRPAGAAANGLRATFEMLEQRYRK